MNAAPLRIAALAIMAVLAAGGASAVQPDEVLNDPRMESRARDISSGLRCLVCQNQSIDDSDAPLARDLRLIVRERLKAGDSDAQIQDYVVGRYGEYVLLRPVLALHTLLLWLTPVVVLGLGALGIWRLARSRKSMTPQRLTAAEEAEIAALTHRD
ncbi:cytochrome c-type biogenesis protein CcmH [uncultured Methylobacterium sp.]|uniref:cytochrome c-type biogenesis protein n=1 Tax=uncultured Methylobacterium sp. TaxID=157278 RepID=UPI0035C9D79F